MKDVALLLINIENQEFAYKQAEKVQKHINSGELSHFWNAFLQRLFLHKTSDPLFQLGHKLFVEPIYKKDIEGLKKNSAYLKEMQIFIDYVIEMFPENKDN